MVNGAVYVVNDPVNGGTRTRSSPGSQGASPCWGRVRPHQRDSKTATDRAGWAAVRPFCCALLTDSLTAVTGALTDPAYSGGTGGRGPRQVRQREGASHVHDDRA